jgi:hypothetical protein
MLSEADDSGQKLTPNHYKGGLFQGLCGVGPDCVLLQGQLPNDLAFRELYAAARFGFAFNRARHYYIGGGPRFTLFKNYFLHEVGQHGYHRSKGINLVVRL